MLIEIDADSLFPREELVKFEPAALRSLARTLATLARAKWIQLANDRLHKTSQDYVRAIQRVTMDGDVASVVLVGAWPNMLEEGFGPFDMRDTLLGDSVPVVGPGGGRGKKESKAGHYYRSIFFRLMSASATGRNAQRVTDAYARFLGADEAKRVGKAAWAEMKRISPSTSNPGGKTQWGGRLPEGAVTNERGRSHALAKSGVDVAGSSRGGQILPEGTLIRHGGAEHKTDLFAGAVKMKQGKSTFYGTFRTISTATTDGWIHPGYNPGAHLAPEAARFATSQLPVLIEKLRGG